MRLFEVQEAVETDSLLFWAGKTRKRKERREMHDIYTVCDRVYIGFVKSFCFFSILI